MRIVLYKTILDENKCCKIVGTEMQTYQTDKKLNDPKRVFELMCAVFQHNKQSEEYLYMLCFTTDCKLLGVFELSHGSVDTTIYNPREIFQKAFLCNATGIILVHNHPLGSIMQSKADIDAYYIIKKAADIMGVSVFDNIIIGDSYYSFHEKNNMDS